MLSFFFSKISSQKIDFGHFKNVHFRKIGFLAPHKNAFYLHKAVNSLKSYKFFVSIKKF